MEIAKGCVLFGRDDVLAHWHVVRAAGGAGHPLSNEAIAAKFNALTDGVAAKDRTLKLQDFLLNTAKQEKAVALLDLLETEVANVLT